MRTINSLSFTASNSTTDDAPLVTSNELSGRQRQKTRIFPASRWREIHPEKRNDAHNCLSRRILHLAVSSYLISNKSYKRADIEVYLSIREPCCRVVSSQDFPRRISSSAPRAPSLNERIRVTTVFKIWSIRTCSHTIIIDADAEYDFRGEN